MANLSNINNKFLVTTGGNVGINTTSPEEKLNVIGSVLISNNEFYKVENTTGTNYKIAGLTNGNVIQIGAIDYTSAGTIFAGGDNISITTGGASGTTRVKIDSSGNVGIGTTSPSDYNASARNLVVYSTGNTGITIASNNTSSDGTIRFADGTGGTAGYRGSIQYSHGGDFMNFNTAALERMRIDSSGNVGIGTTSITNYGSTYKNLDVSGSNGAYLTLIGTNNTVKVDIAAETNAGYVGTKTGHPLIIRTDDVERLRIDANGKVGIGTSSPDGNLEVIASTTVSGASDSVNNVLIGLQAANRPTVILDTADTTYTNRTWNITNVGSAGSLFFGRNGLDVLVMKNDGNVGIGTTSPQRKLDVSGTALIASNGNVNKGTLALGVQDSGSTKWSVITGAHYNAASGSGNGSGSAGIMMIGTLAQNGENDVVIGGNVYETNAATSIQFWTHTTDTSTAGGTRRMIITSNGNVGMGSTSFSPATGLHLYYQNSADMGSVLTLGNNGCCVSNRTGVGFKDGSYYRSGIVFETSGTDGYAGHIIFKKSSNSTTLDGTTETMRIHSNGNVGIGTTAPRAKLEVNGELIAQDIKHSNFAVSSLSTTGYTIATVTGGGNGQSAQIEFIGMGGTSGIVDVVYSCTNQGGNWYAYKKARQTPTIVDVDVTGHGTTTLSFIFKSLSGTASYTPRLMMKGSPSALVTF